MDFNPVVIKHIDDVLPHIKDKKEIIHIVKDDYQVLDYVYVLADTFDNPYAIECRGLKFDKEGNLIARPYHKFKNVGEDKEYSTTRVDLSKPHVRLDKLDGSMVHNVCVPYVNSDGNPYSKWELMTRKGKSEVAVNAQNWLLHDDQVDSGIADAHMKMWHKHFHMTFIYEYVGPNNKIVIDYDKEELILTGARNTKYGHYWKYSTLKRYAEYYGIPCVGVYEGTDVSNDDEKEGCIIRFDTGAMAKVKSDIYVRKHRSKDLVCNFKDLVKLIVEDNLDDVLPQLDEEVKAKVVEYRDDLSDDIRERANSLMTFINELDHLDQKSFALAIEDMPSNKKPFYFGTRKTRDPHGEILRSIKRAMSDTQRLTHLFEDLAFPIWTGDFFKSEI